MDSSGLKSSKQDDESTELSVYHDEVKDPIRRAINECREIVNYIDAKSVIIASKVGSKNRLCKKMLNLLE